MNMRNGLAPALLLGALCLVMPLAAAKDNTITIDGSTTVGPIAKAFAEYYMGKYPEVQISVSESGSGNGAKSLINGACDIATMSRPMKNSELQGARDAGILPIEHVVAMDGIAVVVHPSNPVGAITLEQLREIYAGTIASWKALGGPDQPIVVISRDTNSGTYETFEALALKGAKMAAKVEYAGSNGAIRDRVIATPAAVGYVGMGFLDNVKALEVEGVAPVPETVLAKIYPLARPLFMYTNGRPKEGSPLAQFIGLAQLPEGKKIIADLGFVPLPGPTGE
jgi:phosphate transport system substrate-binding protein